MNNNLADRREEYLKQIELYARSIEDIESGREQLQSRNGLNTPWQDVTQGTLAQRKKIKADYERLLGEVESRMKNGES